MPTQVKKAMFEQPYDALNWLCEKSGNKRIYALLRGSGLFHHQESVLFQACVSLSEILRDDVDCVIRLLQHHDWRNQVIGNVVVVLNRDTRYEQTYVEKLTGKDVRFPAPLAAGWIIINSGSTISTMQAFLMDMGQRSDKSQDSIPYGRTLAVYAALKILNQQWVKEFEVTELFQFLSESSYYPRIAEDTQRIYHAYLGFKPTI
jgi:hypothetical protein